MDQHLVIDVVAPRDLTPSPNNARTHSPAQIAQIIGSIREFGFVSPVLTDELGTVIAGHGRLQAAQELQLKEIPRVIIRGLAPHQIRALMLADNKIALNAGWDLGILRAELAALDEMDLDFDLTVTGFDTPELDIILSSDPDGESLEAEEAPLPDPDEPQVAIRGDLWQLGQHRVLCGDARDETDYATLMGDDRASAVFTDPPFNVKINGHVGGKGRTRHREFAEASGEMTGGEFERFLTDAFGLISAFSLEGSVAFACMDWRHLPEAHAAGMRAWGSYLNLCVWTKTNGGMGSLYRSQHELVLVFRKGRASHRNNVQLGRFGRNRTNVWKYAGVNTFRKGRMAELRAHPTAKPVRMVRDALLDVTGRGDLVLDPFLGAGATLIAAERSGRRCAGLEIDPAYVDVILRRWRTETGLEPVRVHDGRTLASLEAGPTVEASR